MSDGSVAPLMTSLTSSVLKSKMSSSSSSYSSRSDSVDRAWGTAASFGLSLAMLRFAVYSYKTFKRFDEDNDGDVDSITVSSDRIVRYGELGSYNAWIAFVRGMFRRLLYFDPPSKDFPREATVELDCTMITHQGSCHCESIHFEVLAPRCLTVKTGPGKIEYHHTQVRASNFSVVKGTEYLKTYYVVPNGPAADDSRGAHAFCSRCGVHILYARSKNSSSLEINVHCLDEGIRKLRIESSVEALSDTLPLEGQWDDQLETISESHAYSRFLFQSPDKTSRSVSCDSSVPTRGDVSDDYDLKSFSDKDCYARQPATPSTLSITTAGDSYVAPMQLPSSFEQDSVTRESPRSSRMMHSFPPKPVMVPRTFESQRQVSAASPQIRDQMRYYMGRHLPSSISLSGCDERKWHR